MASLLKNVAGQLFTFGLVNATTGAPVLGATVTGWVTVDGAAQAAAGGVFTEAGHGQYRYSPTQLETNGLDLGFLMTATGAIPVNADFHTDPSNWAALNIDAFGNIGIQSNIKRNVARPGFMFVMTSGSPGTPTTGLTVNGFVALDRGAFNPLVNSLAITQVGNGWYGVDLAAQDVNGANCALRFVAAGANDTNISFWTQP